MPNPLREVAQGKDLYTSFMSGWANDVGGNMTKLVNAHKNIYVSHLNLPGFILGQEFFVHFVCMSQHAGTAEQFEAICEVVG